MASDETFSKRHGYSPTEKEITIREDAPEGLRNYLRTAFYELGKKPSDLLPIVCIALKVAPDGNWTEYPNIDNENKWHLESCEWFRVYDVIEKAISKLNPELSKKYTDEINEYFLVNGIGWKIVDGKVEFRGDKVFESAVENVVSILQDASLSTAKGEIREALKDLSRRPDPDITGAIQHSVACLECVTREYTGDTNATMGELIKKHPRVIPSPLDQAISKMYGFASERGRHLRENDSPELVEAELVVEVAAAISSYLGKKITTGSDNSF